MDCAIATNFRCNNYDKFWPPHIVNSCMDKPVFKSQLQLFWKGKYEMCTLFQGKGLCSTYWLLDKETQEVWNWLHLLSTELMTCYTSCCVNDIVNRNFIIIDRETHRSRFLPSHGCLLIRAACIIYIRTPIYEGASWCVHVGASMFVFFLQQFNAS
jgi:hypothetical protein